MMKNFARAALFLIAVLMLAPAALSANLIQLRVHEDKIFQSESFLLVVTAQGRFAIDDLDTRPLIEKEFIIGNIDSNYNIDRNETYWRIPILSHIAGSREIPSMLIGNNVTTPLPIIVRNKGRVSNHPELSNLIRYEIKSSTDDKHYTNQTIIYTVTVTQPQSVEITNITAPYVKGGTIHLISEQKQAPTNRNHFIAVSTKTYAVSFSEPGNYEIEQPTITGKYDTSLKNVPHSLNNPVISNNTGTIVLTDPSKQRSSQSANNGKRTKLRFVQQNPKIRLTIDGFENLKNLIVADDFKIKESWTPKTKQIEANTPITHELEFEATGASVDNFPKITMRETPQFKVYEDKGYTSETYDPKTGILKSKQVIRYIYIPLKKMKLHFEPIQINWISANNLKTDLNVFNLKTIDYDVLPLNHEQYDLDSKYQNKLLYIALFILIILLGLCILYLLYLENIIKFKYLGKLIYNSRIRKNLLKNFSTTDAKINYSLILDYAQNCISEKITCFEMMPQYEKFKDELDSISYFVWKKKKGSDESYDGTEFKKKLKQFIKVKASELQPSKLRSNSGFFPAVKTENKEE